MLRGLVRPFHKEVPSITAYSSKGRNTTINIRGLGTGVAGSAQPVSTPVSASTSTTCSRQRSFVLRVASTRAARSLQLSQEAERSERFI